MNKSKPMQGMDKKMGDMASAGSLNIQNMSKFFP